MEEGYGRDVNLALVVGFIKIDGRDWIWGRREKTHRIEDFLEEQRKNINRNLRFAICN